MSETTFPKDIVTSAAEREFPPFSLRRLLSTVFEPTEGCRVCILTDLDNPAAEMKDFNFLQNDRYAVQRNAHKHFYLGLHDGVMDEMGMTGGDMFAYHVTRGSNLDMRDECWDSDGRQLSLDQDIYPTSTLANRLFPT